MSSPDNVVRIQKSIGVGNVISKKSNPVKSTIFPSSAVRQVATKPSNEKKFHLLWLATTIADVRVKYAEDASIPIWMGIVGVVVMSQDHHICMVWSTSIDHVLTSSHIVRRVIDSDDLVSIDAVVLEFNRIAVCVTVLKCLASVCIAFDSCEEVHPQIREEVL